MHRHIYRKQRLMWRQKAYMCVRCGKVTNSPRWPFWRMI